jgi:hypothetical protein
MFKNKQVSTMRSEIYASRFAQSLALGEQISQTLVLLNFYQQQLINAGTDLIDPLNSARIIESLSITLANLVESREMMGGKD